MFHSEQSKKEKDPKNEWDLFFDLLIADEADELLNNQNNYGESKD